MRRQAVSLLLAGGLAVSLSGCAALLVGAGVAGGYAISRDSVRNLFDLPRDHLFDVSREVLQEMGAVTLEDRAHGRLKAEIQDVNVTVTVKQLTKKTVELTVQARSDFLMPKVDVAQEVYTKIIDRL